MIGGLREHERRALENCETFNGARVQLAQAWLVRCIVRRRRAGTRTPPSLPMRSQHPELAGPAKRCLDARAGCLLALGSLLRLVGTASARR